MASREGRGGFTPEPGTGAASGGHLTPETQGGGSIYDPLNAPLPSEIEAQRAASDTGRTDVIPRERDVGTSSARGRRRRPGFRRVRRTIKHVDPLSVLKLSMFFYSCFLVFWLIFVAVFYSVLESTGAIEALVGGGEVFFGWDIEISLFFVEKWAFFIGLVLVILGSLINLFLAFLYNVGSDLVGGVEMTFVERDL